MNCALLLAASGAASSSPPVAGFVGWWDFSDAASITMDGSQVGAIADKSGNGRTLSKGANGPTRVTSAGLGAGALSHARFASGVTGARVTRADASGVTGDFTLLVAARKQTDFRTSGTSDYLVGGLHGLQVGVDNTALFINKNGSFTTISTTPADWNTAAVHVVKLSGTSYSVWRNLVAKLTNSAGSVGSAAETTLGNPGATDLDWDIGEAVLYASALSDANREAVTTYLAAKWGA